MRPTFSARLHKAVSIFFAASLCCGLIPTAAFAAPNSLSLIPEGEQGVVSIPSGAEGGGEDVLALRSVATPSVDGDDAVTSENVPNMNEEFLDESDPSYVISTEASDSERSGEISIPAASERINETMTLQTRTVAQAESTRSYFLAQTLESTRTVPIVSANLPLDTGNNESNEASQEEEGDDGDDDSEGDDSVGASFSLRTDDSEPATGGNGIAASSTVIGSFTYNGLTYAVEPGGETVAVVAADYNQLPEAFIENQVIVLPSMVTSDGLDYYTVSRIADYAFAGINIKNLIISASITDIADEAFSNFSSLESINVSAFNETYSSYDGCLYGDAETTNLLLIPEGRQGAVRIASATKTIDSKGVSHCPSVEAFFVDEGGAAFSSRNGLLYNESGSELVRVPTAAKEIYLTGDIETIADDAFTGCVFSCIYVEKEKTAALLNKEPYDVEIAGTDANDTIQTYGDEVSDLEATAIEKITNTFLSNRSLAQIAVRGNSIAISSTISNLDEAVELAKDTLLSSEDNLQWDLVFERQEQDAASLLLRSGLASKPYSIELLISIYRGEEATVLYGEAERYAATKIGRFEILGNPTVSTYNAASYPSAQSFSRYDAYFVPTDGEYTFGDSTTMQTVNSLYSKRTISFSDELKADYTNVTGHQDSPLYQLRYATTLGFYIYNNDRTNLKYRPLVRSNPSGDAYYHARCEQAVILTYSSTGAPMWNTSASKAWIMLVPPAWYTKVTFDGTYTDTSNDNYKITGTWIASKDKTKLGTTVSKEVYNTGVNEGQDSPVDIGLTTSDKYYMPIPDKASIPELYQFVGWNTETDGTGDWYYRTDGEPTKQTVTESVTLHAIYTRGYPIKFQSELALSASNIQETFYAFNLAFPAKSPVAKPECSGYTFKGYYEKLADGSKNYWYDANGNLIANEDGSTFSQAEYGYPLEQGYTLYADWVRDIELDTQSATTPANNQKIHVTWKGSLPEMAISGPDACDPENGPVENHATTPIVLPQRQGYVFNGFWSTKYDESDPAKNLYYEEKNRAVVPVAGKTWDVTPDTQDRLYAHWKYKIVLNLNTFYGNGQLAVKDGKFVAEIPRTSYTATATVTVGTTPVEVYTFEAIDGAPITLPSATRTGYKPATKWDSAASGGGTGLSGTLAEPFYPGNDLVATEASTTDFGGMALVLLADWYTTGPNGERIPNSETYKVTLQGKYGDFTPTNSYTQEINALYDAPLLIKVGNDVVVYADYMKDGTKTPVTAPVIKNGNEFRYVFGGYRDVQNALGGDDGTEYIAAAPKTENEQYTGSDVAVSSTLFRTASATTLYAQWCRVESRLTIALQDGVTDPFMVDGLVLAANQPVSALPVGFDNIPVRQGYEFKGYYCKSTKLTSTDTVFATYAKDDTTVAYYVPNKTTGKVEPAKGADDEVLTWPYYTNTTLYAHWEYNIECKLVHENDCASNPAAGDFRHTSVGLKSVPASNTDRFGNAYPSAGSLVTDESSTSFTITALAGVPVLLPYAQGRNGYQDTNAWFARAGHSATGSALPRLAVASSGYTADASGALAAPAFGIAPNASGNANKVTLYVDWTGQQKMYWVQFVNDVVNADGGTETLSSIKAGVPAYAKVSYDALFPALSDSTNDVISSIPADLDTNRNLVFCGFYSEPASIAGTLGTKYVNADKTAAAKFAPRDRAIENALVKDASASAPAGTVVPVKVYAQWTYPTCWVTFDLNTGTIDGSTDSVKAFELQTNDSLPYLKTDSRVPARLKTAPVKKLTSDPTIGSDYVFDGYWSSPSGGDQYYTAALDPADGKETWDRAGDTKLYAHWTYTIELNLNAEVPAALATQYADGLSVSSASTTGPVPSAVTPAAGQPVTAYVMNVTWGAEVTVPSKQANVERVRYARPSLTETIANDYFFDGWYRTDGLADADLFSSAANHFVLGDANRDSLQPSNGTVSLYAKWSSTPYQVKLDHITGTGAVAADFETTGEGTLSDVYFDQRVLPGTDEVAAPHRMGYEFLGYYTVPQDAKDADGNPVAGVKYLEADPDDATLMRATPELWAHMDASAGATVKLYAHYEQRGFTISFSKESPRNNTETNEVTPRGDVAAITGVHYGDKYNDLTYSRAAITLACDGYEFLGWSTKQGATADDADTFVFNAKGAGIGTFLQEESLDVYPVWVPKEYTISWDRAYPTGVVSKPWTTKQLYGDPLRFPNEAGDAQADPDTPVCTGWTFDGWFRSTDKDAAQLTAGVDFRPTGNALSNLNPTYFAHWSVKHYQVKLLPGAKGSYSRAQHGTAIDADGNYVKGFNVAMANAWKFQQPAVENGYHFETWLKLKDGIAPEDADPNDADMWEPTSHTMISKDQAGFPDVYADAVYLATYAATPDYVTLDLGGVELSDGTFVAAPDSALDDSFSKTGNSYSVEAPFTLPTSLKWPGYTFLGWYKTAPADAVQAEADASRNVTVTVANDGKDGNPRAVTYTARWVKDAYTVRFVEKSFAPYNEIEIAPSVQLGRGDTLTIPTPGFRDAFPENAAVEHYAVVFDKFAIDDVNGNATEYAVGKSVVMSDLIDTLKLRDADGGPLRNGSTITFYATWDDTYHIDVAPSVNIRFDPDRVEESLVAGEGWIRATNPQQAKRFKVMSVLIDPVAATDKLPGTTGAFATAAGTLLDDAFLTLSAYPEHVGTSASVAEPIEFNLGAMVANGSSLASEHKLAAESAPSKLEDVGFTFGSATKGSTEAERTLQLRFGLRFAPGVDARELSLLNGAGSYRDTNAAVAIANVFYTIGMAS